jgi:hypothetical protein
MSCKKVVISDGQVDKMVEPIMDCGFLQLVD